jgi:hypothetical protein
MAADDIDDLEDDADELDDQVEEPDEELDEELDDDDLSTDLEEDVAEVPEEEDDDSDDASAAAKAPTEDDDDEEDLGPDDVEADLDTILKGKIASEDDLDDDDEEEEEALVVPVKKPAPVEQADGVTAKQEGEFTCPGCFMVVHPRQFGRRVNPTCPSGEEDCPGIQIAFGTS